MKSVFLSTGDNILVTEKTQVFPEKLIYKNRYFVDVKVLFID